MTRSAVLTPMLLLILGGLLAWRMLELTPSAQDQDLRNRGRTEVQALVEDLVQAKLLQTQPDASLTLPQTDQALYAAWQYASGHSAFPPNSESQRLLHSLYGSAAGAVVRTQVDLWNRNRHITAMRDNGHGMGATGNWHAYRCDDHAPLNVSAQVAAAFGYLHQGHLQTGFGDWTALAAATACVEWRGQFQAPQALPITMWYVGQALPNQNLSGGTLSPYEPPRSLRLQSCAAATGIPSRQAGAWHIPKSAWHCATGATCNLSISLQLAPAQNPSLDAPGLQVGVALADCRPHWQRPPVQRASMLVEKIDWHINTNDGVPLLVDKAQPTDQAKTLGLLPLLGYSSEDTHGLGRRLTSVHPTGNLPPTLILTLDSRYQRAARAALLNGLNNSHNTSALAAERRATVVLLRGDGAILAAVGYPEFPDTTQLTPWDLTAFAKVYPLNNPLLVRAWEGVDRHQTAGSTFKPVVALTGLAAVAQLPIVSNMLTGLSPPEFRNLTGLGLEATSIDPYWGVPGGNPNKSAHPIKNFSHESLGKLCNKIQGKFACTSDPQHNLGLASAVRESLNIWFVALELLLDGKAADSYQHEHRTFSPSSIPTLRLVQSLHSLGFGSAMPLFMAPPADLGAWLHSEPDQLDILGRNPRPLRTILAQASIGQGVFVTPLRMATLAATLAAHAYIKPHLDAAWSGTPVTLQPPSPLEVDTSLLRNGMQQVIRLGTAHEAFASPYPPQIREHTYAKTGTAQVARSDGSDQLETFNTAWIIGWYEPPAPQQRLAFACMISHTKGTGGEVCAPVIAKLLQSLFL